jgi:hypothetical protein
MKRIDFVHGVALLTFIMMSPFVLSLFGYLDEPTYVLISNQNSFHGETRKPVPAFELYEIYLQLVYIVLFTAVCVLTPDHTSRRVSRFQKLYYRPYYIYHCMVCLIPVVARYVHMNAGISDDVMSQIQWDKLFFTIFSVFRFIFSFCLSIFQRHKKWRLLLYILITVFLAFVFSFLLSSFFSTVIELISMTSKSNAEFFTFWTYHDYEQLPDKLNVSKVNTIHKYYPKSK